MQARDHDPVAARASYEGLRVRELGPHMLDRGVFPPAATAAVNHGLHTDTRLMAPLPCACIQYM